MKPIKQLVILTLIPALAAAHLAAQESEFLATGPFDAGRLQANLSLTNHAQTFWNGGADNPGNVGWNSNGMWWSFVRFGSGSSLNTNPELFNKIAAADEVYLHLGVLWLEVLPALAGLVEPGVSVSLFLVPGLDIPEGALPSWNNAWPYSYPRQIKIAEINPATVPTTNTSWGDYGFNKPTEQQRLDNLVAYNMTAAIKQAISEGLLEGATPWGIVFFTEEALPLTPNDPKYQDARQTVLDARYIRLELVSGVEPPPTGWAGYEILESGWVDTGGFLGFVYPEGDYVWIWEQARWVYLPESAVLADGAWMYLFK